MSELRDVSGYSGKYKVNKAGEVFSFANPSFSNLTRKGRRKMKTKSGLGGYLRIGLRSKENKQKLHLVHRIVWAAFNGPIPPLMEINHMDCDKANNAIWNLEPVTKKKNAEHAKSNGRYVLAHQKRRETIERNGLKRTSIGAAKLSESDVNSIRRYLSQSNTTQTSLSKKFNVSISAINKIAKGRTWTKQYV